MVPRTRRHLLQVAAVTVAGLAGCSQFTSGSGQSSSSSTQTHGETDPAGTVLTDPPMLVLRSESDRPAIQFSSANDATDTPPGDRQARPNSHGVIDSTTQSQRLSIADGVDRESVSAFMRTTNFDTETVFLESVPVEECYRLQLCRIGWQSSEIRTDYTRVLRPYDEACAVDTTVYESRLVRLPTVLDADAVRSFRTSVSGSGRCTRGEGSDRNSEQPPGTSDSSTGESQ
jgi:hypothetical protein